MLKSRLPESRGWPGIRLSWGLDFSSFRPGFRTRLASSEAFFRIELNVFFAHFNPINNVFLIIKIYKFRGDLTDVLAESASLLAVILKPTLALDAVLSSYPGFWGAYVTSSFRVMPVLRFWSTSVLLFSKLSKFCFGHADPEMILLDNENKYFLGRPNRYVVC